MDTRLKIAKDLGGFFMLIYYLILEFYLYIFSILFQEVEFDHSIIQKQFVHLQAMHHLTYHICCLSLFLA